MIFILTSGVAFVVTLALTRLFIRPESRMHILDHPNERSLHTQPTPRTGGVAIVCGIGAGSVVATLSFADAIPNAVFWLGGLGVLIASVSYWDDRRNLPIGLRLAVHFVAAAALVMSGGPIEATVLPGVVSAVALWLAGTTGVLFAVWMVNLYNFMDGMDGFAGGMAVVGFGTFALLGGLVGDPWFATLNLIVAAAAGGFLVFNFPPAKIFMGDTGSSTLGFLAAGMALWGNASNILPLWMSMLIFSPFVVDATVTLLRRVVSREYVWHAHKTHYYQRLVQAGWGHRRTVLLEYTLMVVCAGAALVSHGASTSAQWTALVAVAMLYGAFFLVVRTADVRAKLSIRGRD